MADDVTPPPTPPAPRVSQPILRTAPAAIWSLVLAILSFTCGWLFTAIPAVICGHVARSKIRKSRGALGGKGIATAGLILGYIALVVGVMGIPLLVSMIQSDRERLNRLATERKEIASDDGKIKVTVPGTWTKLPELNKRATLQVGDKSKEVYLIVISDAKADLDNMTLEKDHDLTRDRMFQKMKNASATEPVSLMIDGHPALQDELTGKFSLRSAGSQAALSGPPNVVCFHGLLQFHLGENRSREQKGLGYPSASNEAACPSGAFAEEVQMQVTGTEKGTNVVFLHTTVDD